MKKTIVLLLCILFTCSFAACSKPNVEYTVYSYSASAITDATIGANEVSFKSIEEKNFMITLGNTTTRPDNTPEQQTFEIIGETYTLPYDYTTQTPMAECETLKDYSLITTYQNVTDDYSVKCETSVSTGEILFFSKSGNDVRNVSGKLTEQEAIEIANYAISSLYGNEAQQAYVYQTIIPVTDNGRNFYAVGYCRYVWGYPTKEKITVCVNKRGEVVGVNALTLNLLSYAEEDVTKQEIDNAVSVLHEMFSEKWSFFDEALTIDSKGDYYFTAQISRTVDGMTEVEEVYINVQ